MLWTSCVVPLFAQAAPGGAANPAAENLHSAPWLLLVAAIATIAIPYMLGNLFGNLLRMSDYGWKIGLILIALTAGVVIDVAGIYTGSIKRGIDLSGGVKLVYEIDQEKLQEVNVDDIIRRVADEVNSAGSFSKNNPAKVTPGKNGTLEVRLPTTDDDRIKKVEKALSSFDLSAFSAELNGPTVAPEDKLTVLTYRVTRTKVNSVPMNKLIDAVQKRVNPGGQLEVAIRQLGADQIEVDIPDVSDSEIDLIKKKISTAGSLEFHIVADQNAPQDADIIEAAKQQTARGNRSNDVSDGQMVVGRWVDVDPNMGAIEPGWLTRQGPNGVQVLMAMDQLNVTGQNVSLAQVGNGMHGPQVNFQFDSDGAQKFGQLTGQNLPQQNGLKRWLAIVLDGQLKSAATINSKITSAGEITGDSFTEADVEFIVGVLNAGALPAALEKNPVSEERISAELGRDTIHSSEMAMFVSGIAVLIFMLIYYRFAGIVADAAVLFNLLLVLAFMIVLKAAFTLAGLAGLVLSIGMAVDSNVLIYERMREEKERGAALRMVIRNGFGRAMATIIDMHSTTIITGVVLYLIGTEQLRGFAVTLVLGLLVNLFTAVFCARVVFDIAERKRWLTQLKMLRLFGDTKIDFVRIMVPAICVSILISVLGVACFWHRQAVGPNMFDTDFTGGTEVHVVLRQNTPLSDSEVRKLTESDEKYLPDVTVVAVEQKENTQFIIRTSNQKPDEVKSELVKLFGNKLQTYGVTIADLHEITAAEAKASAASSGANPAESTNPAPPAPKSSGANKSSAIPGTRIGLFSAADVLATFPMTGATGLLADTTAQSTPDNTAPGTATDSKTPKTKAPAATSPNAPAAKSTSPASTTAATTPADAKAPATLAPAKSNTASSKPAAAVTPPASHPATPASATPPTNPATTLPITPPSSSPSAPSTGTSAFTEPGSATGPGAFVGGTEATLHFALPIPYDGLESLMRDALGKDDRFELTSAKYHAGDRTAYDTWTLRVALPPAQATPLLEKFRATMDKTPVFLGVSNIGGRVAGDTQATALYALLASIAMIVVYIWIRFQNVIYGVGAVVALIHDVFITVAALAISSYVAPYLGFALVDPFKISLNVVAAILTICGYSISDTIVIFDRIREVRGKSPDLTPDIINLSVNQTLSRTVLTVFTVLLVTLILYTSGGQAIHPFAFTMLVGLISGTYSSVYIAAPCLLWMRSRKQGANVRVSD